MDYPDYISNEASSPIEKLTSDINISNDDETHRSITIDSNNTYKMDGGKNYALIINNQNFENDKIHERQGSDRDASAIKKALESLHFDVSDHKNLSVKEMEEKFEHLSKMNYENYNCFVCVILTHGGDDNVIHGTDGKVKLGSLMQMLLPDRCQSLMGKPKLFFVQAALFPEDKPDCPGKGIQNSEKLPLWADVLLAYSTIPGFYSWENSTIGSWFIQSLAHILEKDGDRLELQRLMLSVNRRVAYEYEKYTKKKKKTGKWKQVPCILNMLTKKLKFHK
ncbi:caspase-3-like [Octopus sinensis]|uniref:Caspase-3-like n=1 Tax=Octopus sinensis TaxID=2607531 RepID=A0A7E6EK62_9MOLL|nr:caspase-3-like [Octopus sinensis]